MGREGFEPSKAKPTDLQSAPFDRSGTSPLHENELTKKLIFCQAGYSNLKFSIAEFR